MSEITEVWQPWPGPTGTTGPSFLGVTGAVTGAAFFGETGATAPTGTVEDHSHVNYLYDRARVELAGASDAMIRLAMYDVFQEFFNDTSLWTEAIPGLLQAGAVFYHLEPGNPHSLGDPFPAGKIIGLGGVLDMNGTPVAADMPEAGFLRLQFTQSNALSVFAVVIKNVAIPKSSQLPKVPKWVVELYEPYLLAGIKSKLMFQPDRPYYEPKMATLQYQYFRQGVSIGRVRALRRNTYGAQAWVFPQQFRTRSQRGFGVSVGNSVRFSG
jgi:hypothetical protein